MIELASDAARVLIDPEHGGRLASLQVYGQELLVEREPDPLRWGCYPMAPWTGRTRHGRFDFAGQRHSLPITLSPHAIHGTVWNRPWECIDSQSLHITLGDDWPFAGYVEQHFELAEHQLRLQLSVHALDEAFPAVIGWHPWFRRRLGIGMPAQLRFTARGIYVTDDDQIPTAALESPGAGPWDDCFTDIAQEPAIDWPGALSLSLRSSLDHWVIYDQPAHALCVEPMSGPPNALNSGAALVTPGQPLRGEFVMSWTRAGTGPAD
jgi:aldose 1-epimerase